jgi:hypothetical protein
MFCCPATTNKRPGHLLGMHRSSHTPQDTFIRSLAFVLGINPALIRVANVIPGRRRLAQAAPATAAGAALVSIQIGEDPAPKPEAPFNMTYNLDMDTSLQVAKHVRLCMQLLRYNAVVLFVSADRCSLGAVAMQLPSYCLCCAKQVQLCMRLLLCGFTLTSKLC